MSGINLDFFTNCNPIQLPNLKIGKKYHAFKQLHPTAVLVGQIALIFFATLTVIGIPLAVWGAYMVHKDYRKKEQKEDLDVDDFDRMGIGMQVPKSGSNVLAAVKSLQGSGKVGDAAIDEYFKALARNHPEMEYVDTFTNKNASADTLVNSIKKALYGRATSEEAIKPFTFIPLVLDGKFGDHIVLMVFDTKARQAYYYDPQGGKFENESRNIRGVGVTLQEIFKKEAFIGYELQKIKSNQVKQQKDHVSCGVFCIWFAKTFLKEVTPESSPDQVFERLKMAVFDQKRLNNVRRDAVRLIEPVQNLKL